MNKAFLPHQWMILICVIIFLCLTSCGIETFVYLYPPLRSYENSNLDDESKRYCEFYTADSSNSAASDYFRGTEIYYRIYQKESDCTNDITAINKKNDDNPSGVVEYTLSSKKYSMLSFSASTNSSRPLIDKAGSNQKVRFRLVDYGADTAGLSINGGSPKKLIYRTGNSSRNFSATSIADTDSDVEQSSSPDTDSLFVNFYAASYGYDQKFRTIYSAITHLGYIKLKK